MADLEVTDSNPLGRLKVVKKHHEMSLKLPRLKAMSVFDISKVTTCITLLATEVAPPAEDGVTFKFNKQLEKSRGGLESHMESHNPQPLC